MKGTTTESGIFIIEYPKKRYANCYRNITDKYKPQLQLEQIIPYSGRASQRYINRTVLWFQNIFLIKYNFYETWKEKRSPTVKSAFFKSNKTVINTTDIECWAEKKN